MPTQIKNSDTTDYTLLYFISDIYTKANCILKSYQNNDNTFEANEIMDSLYLGNKLSEELYIKSKQIVKFADVELIDMIDYYKQKVNILHKFT